MQRKSFFILLVSTVFALSFITSCDNERTPLYTSYMTCVEGAAQSDPYPVYFISDDSLRVNPLNHKSFPGMKELKTNDRIIAQFTIPGKGIKDPVDVELVALQRILTKNIVSTTHPDTLGSDRIRVVSAWQCGGINELKRFLNINFVFEASNNGVIHIVNLIEDPSRDLVDSEGYYQLKLVHNSRGDVNGFQADGVASFPFREEMTAEGVKGIKIYYRTYDGTEYYKLTYDSRKK